MAEICKRVDSLEAGVSSRVELQTSARAAIGGGFQRKQSHRFLPKSPKMFVDDGEEEEEEKVSKHHRFLDSCFLCNRRLDGDDDIFMYKGEMAFCSEECREEHIEMDEMEERRRMRRLKKLSTVKVSRATHESSSSHSTSIVVA